MNKDVTVVLADDHEIVRAGLRSLLSQQEGLKVVGEVSNGRAVVESVKNLGPDVVVMDLSMPEMNGIDATRAAIAAKPGLKVIGLSANADDRLTAEMIRAGAAGYLLKVSAFDELVNAIQAVVHDKVYFSPSLMSRLAGPATDFEVESAFNMLSPREREILQLISEGKATKQIASLLKVSVKTVETHRRNLMEKLQVDNVAELTKYAIRQGLTTVG